MTVRKAAVKKKVPPKKSVIQLRSNARTKEDVPRRVYAFGCRRPEIEAEQFLQSQAFKANDVQTAFIRNEMASREAWEKATAKHVPEYRKARQRAEKITAKIEDTYDELAAARQKVRKRVQPADIEHTLEELKKQRREAYLEMGKAKVPFRNELAPFWVRLKQIKEQLQGDAKGSSAANRAQKEALNRMLADRRVPAAWKELAKITRDDHEAHTAIRRTDWRPSLDKTIPVHIRQLRRKAWQTPLDGHVKEMAREAFLQAKAKTGAEGGRMREPRGITGRVGRMWSSGQEPVIGKDNEIKSNELVLTMQEPGGTDNRDPNSRRSQLRKRMLITLRIAGQSISVKALVHRVMPEGAKVRRAWFMLRERGRIDVQLTLTHPSFGQRAPGKRLQAVAIRPGWAALPMREPGKAPDLVAAIWRGSDGKTGRVLLDAHTNRAFDFLDTLRQNQDDYHNETLRELRAWLEKADGRKAAVRRLKQELVHSHSWRSPRHLAKLAFELRETIPNREKLWKAWKESCDKEGADYFLTLDHTRAWLKRRKIRDELVIMAVQLEWWRRKNLHLRTWEQNMRGTVLRRRKDMYRVAAARLAGRYENLIILDVGLKQQARKKAPEKAIEGPERVWTRQRRNAAPSELIEAFANAFRVKADKVRVKAKSLEEALGEKPKPEKAKAAKKTTKLTKKVTKKTTKKTTKKVTKRPKAKAAE